MTLPSGYAAYVVWSFFKLCCVISVLSTPMYTKQTPNKPASSLGGWSSAGAVYAETGRASSSDGFETWQAKLWLTWSGAGNSPTLSKPWGGPNPLRSSFHHFYDWSILCSHGLQKLGELWPSVKEEFSSHLSQSSCVFCRGNMHVCPCLAARLLKHTCFYGIFLFLIYILVFL